ncbi:MAG: response regulator [Eubacterium sp.]|nr:response regulator [Eubacterium sp.]
MWQVMVADDEEYLLEAMKKLIDWQSMDCQLTFCARNGKQLLDEVKIRRPDIIITDIKMPLVDGMAIAKYAYENLDHTIVILLTGYADFEYAKEAIHYDVSDYIIKTSMLELLPESIKKAERKLSEIKTSDTAADAELIQKNPDDLVTQVRRYIETNYFKKITLMDIASAVHVNRSYISRVYKSRTGNNLFDDISRYKINKAKELILDGHLIYEVAEQVGFDDVAYFSRVFKKMEGCFPKEYEKKMHTEK